MNDKKVTPAKPLEDRKIAHNRSFLGETRKIAARLRWAQLWIGVGIALAVSLLVTSISTYFAVSRSVVTEHLRSDVHSEAAIIEDRARQQGVQTNSQLLTVLDHSMGKSGGRLAWVRVQNREGDTIAVSGASDPPTFSKEEIRMHFLGRQPLFRSIDGPGGPMLVETLPFVLPDGPLRPAAIQPGDGPPGLNRDRRIPGQRDCRVSRGQKASFYQCLGSLIAFVRPSHHRFAISILLVRKGIGAPGRDRLQCPARPSAFGGI